MIEIGKATDIGKTRALNEDSFFVSDYAEAYDALFAAVADGMGGHKAGEVASKSALEQVQGFIRKYFTDDLTDENTKKLLEAAFVDANETVYQMSHKDESLSGMGTTLTLLLKLRQKLFIAHVGDSRIYRIRDHEIERLTTDHSIVEALLRSGQITPLQAKQHPQRNMITRAIGTEPKLEVDLLQTAAYPGDIYLLSTDGLTNMVSDSNILSIIETSQSAQGACSALIRAALDAGGTDNITAVIVKI